MGRMRDWFKTWRERRRLKQLIRKMGPQLRQRYGAQEYYTPGQVLTTCDVIGVDETAKTQSVAMYVEPRLAEGILTKMNKSPAANELRKYLIVRCFDNFSDGDQSDYNPFMHASSHEGFSSVGDSFDFFDGGQGGGGSSGHSGGDGGGHH